MDEVVTVDVAMGRLERLEGFGLAVHPERCVRVRHRRASCTRCAQACTSGALSLRDGALAVNEALCVGCGTCATVCPTCAIEARHPSDVQLLTAARQVMRGAKAKGAGGAGRIEPASEKTPARVANSAQCKNAAASKDSAAESGGAKAAATVTFACHRAFAEAPRACVAAGAIELACLSRMEETLAMQLFADGVGCIRLLHGACAGCPRENGFASVALVRETVGKLINTWGLNCAYDVEQVEAEEGEPCRDAELEASECADPASTPAPSPKPTHVQADGTLPHFVPLRRHALLDALAEFGDPAQPALDTRLWGHITIDMRKCKSCKMCAVFCPTGALQKYIGKDGHGGVEHYPAECVHCGLCQDICPAGAIMSATIVPTQALAAGKTERYPMPDPVWTTGPDLILRKMTPQIHSREVQHSY